MKPIEKSRIESYIETILTYLPDSWEAVVKFYEISETKISFRFTIFSEIDEESPMFYYRIIDTSDVIPSEQEIADEIIHRVDIYRNRYSSL